MKDSPNLTINRHTGHGSLLVHLYTQLQVVAVELITSYTRSMHHWPSRAAADLVRHCTEPASVNVGCFLDQTVTTKAYEVTMVQSAIQLLMSI
jgi:hypothetical protein